MINNPHALYYNGELIGIITNPDPHGNINTICECLSPDDGLADARPIDHAALASIVDKLEIPETIPLETDYDVDQSEYRGRGWTCFSNE